MQKPATFVVSEDRLRALLKRAIGPSYWAFPPERLEANIDNFISECRTCD
jgi:hypothetical protein